MEAWPGHPRGYLVSRDYSSEYSTRFLIQYQCVPEGCGSQGRIRKDSAIAL